MAHELDFSKGFASFVSRKTPAWHQLGKVFDTEISVSDAIREGGLDYIVNKSPNIHLMGKEAIESSHSFFLWRSDTNKVLAPHVGKVYETLQNIEAFAIVDELVGNGLKIETAGVLREGQQTFVSLKADTFDVKGDAVDQYLLIINPHNGRDAIRALYTPVRVVCANTLRLADRRQSGYHIRHSVNSEQQVREALNLLGVLEKSQTTAQELFTHLANQQWNPEDFASYIASVFLTKEEQQWLGSVAEYEDKVSTRKRNQIQDAIRYADTGFGQDILRGSAWWGYNAVTGYLRHEWKSDAEALFPGQSLVAEKVQDAAIKNALSVPHISGSKIILN